MNLRSVNLRSVNLRSVNLRSVNLRSVSLRSVFPRAGAKFSTDGRLRLSTGRAAPLTQPPDIVTFISVTLRARTAHGRERTVA
ncbi:MULTISPECIES: pentapeptide repeat-containing protein [Streptomyces]|uniref:pentapeptide repeat-containing protein n=1 Tax=Streptomyces TaxID=1883 RepID=UPI0018E9DA62